MKIYIAGPFSQENERKSLKHMIELVKLANPNAEFYIPMEFKVEGDFQKPDGTWNLPNEEWARRVYEEDLKHLNEADIVYAQYVGHYCSSGTVWEMGYANAKGIPVVAYIPAWAYEKNMSLMVLNSFFGFLDEDGSIMKNSLAYLSQFNQK